MQPLKCEKVIVIGGGFAGLQLLKHLDQYLFDVLLIDKLNHHQFQPLFYQVATSQIEPGSISFPLRKILQDRKNTQIRMAEVTLIDPENHSNNLKRLIHNKPLKEFEYKDKGTMATVGKKKAVVDLPYLKFRGFFAWLVWMFLHLMLILSVRNKMVIFINWAWLFFTRDTSLRLILKEQQ